MWRIKSVVLTLVVAGLISAGCQQKPAPTPAAPKQEAASGKAEPAKKKPHLAVVMKSLANEFFKTMEEGAKTYHKAHEADFDLTVNGIPNEEDIAGQVSLVEQMIVQGVNAIIIAPADSKALVGALDKAMKQGITVVNIDNKLDAEVLSSRNLRIPFVGPNNRAGAKLAADYLAKQVPAGGVVAILEGIPSAFNAQQRKLGLEDGVTAAGLKVATSQSANWEMAKANEIASGMLNEHADLKAILCANDSMALGAHAAVRDAGKAGQVAITGYDNIGAVKELVGSGGILCTVDQHGDQLAVYGIQCALEILAGKSAPEDRETPVELVTKDSPQAAGAK